VEKGPATGAEVGEASLGRVASGSGGGEVEVLEDGPNNGGVCEVGQDAAATATFAAGEGVKLASSSPRLGLALRPS